MFVNAELFNMCHDISFVNCLFRSSPLCPANKENIVVTILCLAAVRVYLMLRIQVSAIVHFVSVNEVL